MKTGTIRFNVRERGRKHRGQDRNFDTVALATLINGGDVQERVKNRDLQGFYGHWPRVMFGMDPREGGIHEGRQVTLEPALITTSIKAMPDGTIEHEAEFLDTVPGRTAKRLFGSKAGGFSSAIAVREAGGRDVPIGFYGFDYVAEPNFTTNRGYALDGVREADGVVLDGAIAENQAALKLLDGLYSELQASFEKQAEVLARVMAERDELVDMVARGGGSERDVNAALARLDGAGFRALAMGQPLEQSSLHRVARMFDAVELPGLEVPEPPAAAKAEDRKLTAVVASFLGRGLRR